MTDLGISNQQMLIDASRHLSSAIDLLDRAAAPGHIAAHADLASNQLEEFISEAYHGVDAPRVHDDQECDEVGLRSTAAPTGYQSAIRTAQAAGSNRPVAAQSLETD